MVLSPRIKELSGTLVICGCGRSSAGEKARDGPNL